MLQSVRRNVEETRKQAEATVVISSENRLGVWLAWGHALHGWAVAEAGAIEAGTAELEDGITVLHATSTYLATPHYFALLAELQMEAGNVERSQNWLAQAMTVMENSGERWCEAELYRLKGELLLRQGEEAEGEAALRRALEVAHAQKARSFELRASIRLAEWWHKQGKSTEARQLLSPIYRWFTEGFDTADLKAARALLNLLSTSTKKTTDASR
jgi:predicted ATPase